MDRIPTTGRLAIATAVALAIGGCALNVSQMEDEREADQGARASQKVEEQIGLVEDEELVAYVVAIGERLAKASARPDLAYHFRILDMPEPNAFALPGGYIYVSRGLLALTNREDELAGVIGHEIGHVTARHHVKQALRDAPLAPIRIATGIGGALTSIVLPRVGQTIAATGQLTSALVHAPYSRDQEREADRIGQQLAADSGWDPGALGDFMHTLGREQELHGGDASRASFLATHPASEERSRAAAANAKTLTVADAAPISKDRASFLARLEGLLVGLPASEGVFDGDDFLHPGLSLAWTLPSGWEQMNSRQAVGAVDRDADRAIVLQVAGEGDDPAKAARDLPREIRLEAAPTPLDLHGLKAVRTRARGGSSRAELTWVAKDGLVFLINGFAQKDDFPNVAQTLRASADSFRPLAAGDRERIREDRLDVVRANAGDTIGDVLARHDSRWQVEEAAIANAIVSDATLEAGQRIKITRPTAVPAAAGGS